jgi:hypothetical protein
MAITPVGKDFHRPIMNRRELMIPTLPFRNLKSCDLIRKRALKIGASGPKTRVKTAERAFRSLSVPQRLPELSEGCIATFIGR